jgi:two-component system chemotaxis response regulator CheY
MDLNLTDERLKQLDNPQLTPDSRALIRCEVAAELVHVGQYEAAREALGELWQGIGHRPKLKGLTTAVHAEVLLQGGVVSGWLGTLHQVADAQEKAKDLLSESLRRFQSKGRKAKVAEAQYELGLCYFRLGAYDESRIVLDEAAGSLSEDDIQLKAKILTRRAFVELWAGRYHDALRVLEEAQSFFESGGDALKGRWHGQMGLVLRRLATAEGRTDYADRAIIEYTAAAYYFEQSHNESYCGRALNNLAFLLYKLARYDEAHENLDRAAVIFEHRNDEGATGQVKETRARVLLAEGRYKEASSIIAGAVRTFEEGGECALLADALIIQGVIWSRLGNHDTSIQVLRRALNIAQESGASSNAGVAALTLIEEHGSTRLSEQELHSLYLRADSFLKDTQDAEEIVRLRACSRVVVQRLFTLRAYLGKEDFTLPKAVEAYEARLIEEALEVEQGSVTHAAKRLGVKHQTLSSILKKRHKHLLKKRTPFVPRRVSIIPDPDKPPRRAIAKRPRTTIILHVEDIGLIADKVREILELKGWRVDTFNDGVTALMKLAGKTRYDLLLFDNELLGMDGLELVRTARKLPHRRRTPIIMFSASDCEAEAWKAGVSAFLRKPEDISAITSMVSRLLTLKPNKDRNSALTTRKKS